MFSALYLNKDEKSKYKKQVPRVSKHSRVQQTSPSVLVPNELTDNLYNMVKKLQCDVKKLELNLKLVDSDNISTEDYNELRKQITSICGLDDGKTEEFFKNMDVKRGVNLLKRIVTYLQIIAPMCGILNLVVVPYIISGLKKIEEAAKKNLLGKCFRTFQKSYGAIGLMANNLTIDSDVDMLDLIGNVADVDLLDSTVEITNPVTGKDALFNVVNSFSDRTVNAAKKLLHPFKKDPNRGSVYNSLIEKCNKLCCTVCLSLWLYIILIGLNKLNNYESEDPLLIMNGGGKKLHTKRNKKSKSKKV